MDTPGPPLVAPLRINNDSASGSFRIWQYISSMRLARSKSVMQLRIIIDPLHFLYDQLQLVEFQRQTERLSYQGVQDDLTQPF